MPTAPLSLALIGWAALSAVMVVLWAIQRRTRNAGPVDAAWAGGLGALAIWYAVLGAGDPGRRALIAVVAGTWSLRLTVALVRRIRREPEDGRYQKLRREWGARAEPRFFWFFQAQALLAVLLSAPFLIIAFVPEPVPTIWDVVGLAVFAVAMIGESVADRQLARFRADPAHRGTTCRVGLWRYSRHPNYFFEWLLWWSYPFLALGSSLAWVTVFSPLILLFLILKVTGIPPTEEQALASRGEDYRRYQRSTSAFLPWFVKQQEQQS